LLLSTVLRDSVLVLHKLLTVLMLIANKMGFRKEKAANSSLQWRLVATGGQWWPVVASGGQKQQGVVAMSRYKTLCS
jgi:hypothetical protein